MTIIQSVVLGIVQGIAEFLPISSSGHLILVPYLLGWPEHTLTFDIALHLGTALAVLVYFYKDWLNMLISLQEDVMNVASSKLAFNFSSWCKLRPLTKLLLTLIIVTIPVGIIGLLFEHKVEELFRSPALIGIMLIVISFYMIYAEKVFAKKSSIVSNLLNRPNRDISFKDSLMISLSQLLALIPGSSRSGMTISTGLLKGYDREKIARFSFLLATPIILGAGVTKIKELIHLSSDERTIFLIGFMMSFIFGCASIKFLLQYLQRHTLEAFVWYRIILGLSILAITLFK